MPSPMLSRTCQERNEDLARENFIVSGLVVLSLVFFFTPALVPSMPSGQAFGFAVVMSPLTMVAAIVWLVGRR